MAKVLVIGAGPAGCASTHFLTNLGHEVTLIERAPVLGGSCRTFYWGGHPYTLGPRHFLTRFEKVWAYFDKYCPMKRYEGHENWEHDHKLNEGESFLCRAGLVCSSHSTSGSGALRRIG